MTHTLSPLAHPCGSSWPGMDESQRLPVALYGLTPPQQDEARQIMTTLGKSAEDAAQFVRQAHDPHTPRRELWEALLAYELAGLPFPGEGA